MKPITTGIRLKPWQVPNFATMELGPRPREEGMIQAPSIPIADLEQGAFDALVERWVNDIYKKAGRERPPQSL